MKKFLFFLLLFFPSTVFASAYLEEFHVLNGTMSIPFNEKNNIYTVILNEEATFLEFDYKLENENAKLEILGNEYHENEENVMTIKVTDEIESDTQSYSFYLEKKETKSVSLNVNDNLSQEPKKEIPYLKQIVIGVCLILIFILFKFLILNFWKQK